MKAKIAFFLMLTAAFICSSCIGLKDLGVLDESVPEAERVNLEIRNSLSVITYNNKPVNWGSGLTKDKVAIVLPPGKSTFTVKWYEVQNAGSAMQRTVDRTSTVTIDMLPGRSYRIYKQNINLLIINFTNIKTKDVTPKS